MSSLDDPLANGARLNAEDLVITNREGEVVEVPEEGSLSLLALGYKGLMAWRAKRVAMVREREARKSERP